MKWILLLLAMSISAIAADVPQVSADKGPCSADFTVTDGAGKPIYNATVHVVVKWGLAHKTDLTVGTDADGKARVAGMPTRSKKAYTFDVRKGDLVKTIVYDPEETCNAKYDVKLSAQ